jgi:hypothetical protein
MAVRLSALRSGRPLPPPPPGSFLEPFSVKRLSWPQDHSAAGRIRYIEKIHLIGTRTRDLPACSIVPQPTTLPRAPLGTTVTNQNLIHEEIKNRLNSGNACYHSVQRFLSFCLPPRHPKIKIYGSIMLSVVLCGCETWSLALRKEHRL